MALIVQKYGGTSVGSIDRIREVAKRVKRFVDRGDRVVVVVSAMSGETNRLLALAKESAGNIPSTPAQNREMDQIAVTGEQVSVGLVALALQAVGVSAVSLTGAQAGIHTDLSYTKARILDINAKGMLDLLEQGKVLVVAGFQGIADNGDITTLGRGGSDTTGVAVAAALKADECQIYTDVNGVYTADPRLVSDARRLPSITFEEMLEMASLGSKVLQIRSVEFAGKYKVKLRVLSSFTEDDSDHGTLITLEEQRMEQPIISGIAHQRDEAKITLMAVPDQPGVAHKILKPIADANLEVDMIVQNVSLEGHTDFSFTVARGDASKAMAILESIKSSLGAKSIICDSKMAKISIVGIGMRSHAGVASKMFETLAKEGINIQMISTSEIKVSVAIDEKYMELAVRSLHQAFELDKIGG